MNCSLIMCAWLTKYWSSSDMNRSKKIFAGFAILFLAFLIYIVYDISSRTTFPHRSGKGEIEEPAPDTVSADTTQR